MKVCFRCGIPQLLVDFYAHKGMADGRLGKCKSCCKKESNKHRSDNIEKVKAYDRGRGNIPSRVKARKIYQKNNPDKFAEANDRWIKKNPEKRKAQHIFSNARRYKKIKKTACEICGGWSRVEAHHDDYAKPLEVRWLCKKHHVEADRIRRANDVQRFSHTAHNDGRAGPGDKVATPIQDTPGPGLAENSNNRY